MGEVKLVLARPWTHYCNYTADDSKCIPEVCGLTIENITPLFWAGEFCRFPPLPRALYSSEYMRKT